MTATSSPALLLDAPELWAAVVVVVVSSAAFGVLDVSAAGLRDRLAPAQLLGRVSATWRTSAYAAGAGGALAGGAVASAQGVTAPFVQRVAVGGLSTAVSLGAARSGPAPA